MKITQKLSLLNKRQNPLAEPSMYLFLKRTFDLSIAAILSILLSPLFVLIYICVAASMGRPALFTQERAGFRGVPFKIYKFRSMNNARDSQGTLLPDSERLTPLGKFLRATSLDEIPQIYNVLKGDMSFVGPRPLYIRYIPRYSERQVRRLDAQPGITGWAQVNGRNAIDWATKLELDVWYIENRSLALDLKIIFLTAKKILIREGINQADRATVDEFMGGN